MADALDALLAKYGDQGQAVAPSAAPPAAPAPDPLDALVAKYSSADVQPATNDYPASGGLTIAPKGGTPTSQAPVGTVEDITRSFASGLENGAISLAGLPGDAQAWIRKGLLAAGIKIPANMPLPNLSIAGVPINAPTSDQISGTVGKALGPAYQPETTAGQYAETTGEFVPAAIGGEGSLVRKAIGQVAVPALTTEAAGQATKGTPLEPIARAGTAVLTGGLGAKAATPKAEGVITPTTEAIGDLAKQAYDAADQSGLTFSGHGFRNMVVGLVHKLHGEGLDRNLHPSTTAAMNRIAQVGDEFAPVVPDAMSAVTGVPPTPSTRGIPLSELDTLRRIAGAAAKSQYPDDRRLASIVIDRLDDFAENPSASDVQSGNAAGADALKQARALWQRFRKSQTLDDMYTSAEDRAGKNYSQSGLENALRTEAGMLLRNKNKTRGWSDDEIDALRQIVRGGSVKANFYRLVGKLAPTGGLSIPAGIGTGAGIGAGIAGPAGVIVGGVAGPALAYLARNAALNATKNNVNRLNALVRGGALPTRPANALVGSAPMNVLLSTLPQNAFGQ